VARGKIDPGLKQITGIAGEPPTTALQREMSKYNLKNYQLYTNTTAKTANVDLVLRHRLAKTMYKDFEEWKANAPASPRYGEMTYNEISEDIILNGQTPVTTVKSYLRINRGVVLTAGSGGKNAGIIRAGTGTVTSGVPANVFLSINGVGDNQTLMCLWTVPAGYTAFMVQTNVSTGNASNTPALLDTSIVARPFGGVFNTQERITLKDGNQLQGYNFPLRFTEKTDLEVRAQSTSASVTFDCSASLEFIYIKNNRPL